MEKEASAHLGEPVTAGVILLASGAARKMRRQAAVGGLVGTAVTAVLKRREKDEAPADDVIGREGGAFLVVTPTRVVLFGIVSGKFRQTLGEPEATFRRGDLAAIELGKAAAGVATVDLVLADQRRYCFEISKLFTKKLQPVADALGVPIIS
jgi:hypothetical protein